MSPFPLDSRLKPAYGFTNMKRLELLFYSSLDDMLVYRRVNPSIKVVDTHLYTWEKHILKVNCFA